MLCAQVLTNTGYIAHMLLNPALQRTAERYSIANNPVSDFLYMNNIIWLSRPSERWVLKLPASGSACGVAASIGTQTFRSSSTNMQKLLWLLCERRIQWRPPLQYRRQTVDVSVDDRHTGWRSADQG